MITCACGQPATWHIQAYTSRCAPWPILNITIGRTYLPLSRFLPPKKTAPQGRTP